MRNLPPINKIHLNTKLLKDLLVGGYVDIHSSRQEERGLGHRDTRFSTPYPSFPKSLSRVTFNAAH